MIEIGNGQCGLCKHFGEHETQSDQLVQIRTSKQAPETYTNECGHPTLEALHVKVTPASSCEGYEPIAA